MFEFTEFVDGYAFGAEAFRISGKDAMGRQRAENLAALCEMQGGAVLAGFNAAIEFASFMYARTLRALA